MSSPGFEDIISAGNRKSWNCSDWKWDSRQLRAFPNPNRQAAVQEKMQLQDVNEYDHSVPTSLCDASRIVLNRGSASADGVCCSEEMKCQRHDVVSSPLEEEEKDYKKGIVPAAADGSVSFSTEKKKGKMKCGRKVLSYFCQADNCGKDLSGFTYYHKRNRICDLHIKANSYMMDGKELRFCQRCGHGHPLEEFDGEKHSCRAQLAKHNARRRRNPQYKEGEKVADESKKKFKLDSRGNSEKMSSHVVDDKALCSKICSKNEQQKPLSSCMCNGDKDEFPKAAKDTDSAVDDLSGWLTAQLNGMQNSEVPLEDEPFGPFDDSDLIAAREILINDASPFESAVELMSVPNACDSSEGSASLQTAPLLTDQAVLNTVSIKLFGCTPAELPGDLNRQFLSWFEGRVDGIQGYLRPGCVHLTLEAFVEPHKISDNNSSRNIRGFKQMMNEPIQSVVKKMLSSRDSIWRNHTLLVQKGSNIVLVHDGQIEQMWKVDRSISNGRYIPSIVNITHPVICSSDTNNLTFTLNGINLLQNDFEILCRFQGKYILIDRAGCRDCKCVASVKNSSKSSISGASSRDWEKRCCGCCSRKIVAKDTDANTDFVHDGVSSQEISLQSVEVRLKSLCNQTGLLHFDLSKGAYVSPWGIDCLVVDDESIKNELLSLKPQTLRHWINALGIIFEWLGDKKKLKWQSIERPACRLLHLSLAAGLMSLAERLHSIILNEIIAEAEALGTEGFAFSQEDGLALLSGADQACKMATLERIEKVGCTDGLSLLHRAVQSSSISITRLVVGWFQEASLSVPVTARGPKGLTPMHLAVLSPDPSTAAHLIITLLSNSEKSVKMLDGSSWDSFVTQNGETPMDFARKVSRNGLIDVFDFGTSKQLNVFKAQKTEMLATVVEQPSTPRRCKCSGDCPCKLSNQPCSSSGSWDVGIGCCGTIDGHCSCCASSKSLINNNRSLEPGTNSSN